MKERDVTTAYQMFPTKQYAYRLKNDLAQQFLEAHCPDKQ